MFDEKVIRGYDFRPPGLSSRELFGGLEVLEILLVALDQDLVIGALDIVPRLFHYLDIGQQLPIVCIVVLFGGRACPRVEIDWVRNPESVVLVMHGVSSEAACIG